MAVFHTPRFSYPVLKTVICTCSDGTTDACTTGYGTGTGYGRVLGTGIRVGYWEGYTGYYPATAQGANLTAKRAP